MDVATPTAQCKCGTRFQCDNETIMHAAECDTTIVNPDSHVKQRMYNFVTAVHVYILADT